MQKLILALILASSLCGCETVNEAWMRSYVAGHDAVDAVLADGQAPAQPATQPAGPQTLWPAVEVDWMIHGEGTGENEIRAAAIRQAAAEGKAIRFKFRETSTDLRIWTVHWESDMRKGYFGPENVWSQQAYDAGIRKWVVETDCPDELVIDTFKAYGGPGFQLQIIGASPGVIKGLGLDSNGIKTSPPRYRQ